MTRATRRLVVRRGAGFVVGTAIGLAAIALRLAAQDSVAAGIHGGRALAFRGATVHTAIAAPLRNATIVVRGGKIAAVGVDIPIPDDAEIVDVTGREIIPGMIDNHAHIGFGIEDANDVARFTPRNRIVDVLSSDPRYWDDAVEGGVTTIVTGPGSGPVSSGQAAVVKTWGHDWHSRLLVEVAGLKIGMGRKSAAQSPSTSMAVISFLRAQFIKAQEYMETWRRYEASGRAGLAPARDADLEVLARVLRREQPLRVHVLYAHHIVSLLRLKREFGFDMSIHHAVEAHKVITEIAESGVGVVGMPLFFRIGVSEEVLRGPAEFAARGVLFAFHTDAPVIASSQQRLNGAVAIRYGMPELDALKALTINGARIAGVADRVGSIEVGKDADLVVLDGPWYELKTRIERVLVDGAIAYLRTKDNEP